MKKIVMALLCLLAIFTKAQAIEVGDAAIVDGYPVVVIFVDESGEHGLYMTGTALTEEQFTGVDTKANKRAEKYMKKQGIELPEGMPELKYPMPFIKYAEKMKVPGKMKKQIESELLPKIGGQGEENQKAILQFCEDNKLDAATFFPLEYWATQLGEGWYIPGADEVFYLRQMITGNGPAKNDFCMDMTKKENTTKLSEVMQKFGAKAGEQQFMITFPGLHEKIYTSTFDNTPWSEDKENKKFITIEDHFTNVMINGPMAAASAKKYGAKEEQASPVARISYRGAYITNAWWGQVVAVKKF